MIAVSVWLIVYCCTTQNVPFLILFLGWFLLISLTVLRLTWLLMIVLSHICALLMINKQFGWAELCARCCNSICSWWFNLCKISGKDGPGIIWSFLDSLVILANCYTATGKIDDEIEIRQQIVELASSLKYYCCVAESCDSLAYLFLRKKDRVHARHWAERAIGYYEQSVNGACVCPKEHKDLNGKRAALHATLAEESLHEGFASTAEVHAQKAEELIRNCPDTEAYIAVLRLMNFYFEAKHWEQFQLIANRYLTTQQSNGDSSSYLADQAIIQIRFGTIYAEAGDYSQAESSILSGIELAKRSGDKKLTARGESVLATFRQKQL